MIQMWLARSQAFLAYVAPKFSFSCLAVIAVVCFWYTTTINAKTEQATMCLAENIYHEARGELPGNQYILGMLTLARVSDPSPQWPKTICGVVAQDRQFSWTLDYKLATDRSEQKKWDEAQYIAHDLIENAWRQYLLPKGWQCARWY